MITLEQLDAISVALASYREAQVVAGSWPSPTAAERHDVVERLLFQDAEGLIALARDAYRFRALAHSLENDAREARKGDDAARLKFCENVIVDAGVACVNGEESGLDCFCSWREENLKEERDKFKGLYTQKHATLVEVMGERDTLALLLNEAIGMLGDGSATEEWLANARAAMSGFAFQEEP